MMTILTYIWYVLLAVFVLIIFLSLVIGFKLLVWFSYRVCKHCHHTMDYKGLREDENNGHYLFHCEHCGAWEEVPKEEFIRSCDKDCNPNEL
jgi:hypothetical protein